MNDDRTVPDEPKRCEHTQSIGCEVARCDKCPAPDEQKRCHRSDHHVAHEWLFDEIGYTFGGPRMVRCPGISGPDGEVPQTDAWNEALIRSLKEIIESGQLQPSYERTITLTIAALRSMKGAEK